MKRSHKTDPETRADERVGSRYLFICSACRLGSEIPADRLERLCPAQARVADALASMECAYCGTKGG